MILQIGLKNKFEKKFLLTNAAKIAAFCFLWIIHRREYTKFLYTMRARSIIFMESNIKSKNWLRVLTVFVGCLAIRLVPLRAPNVEPLLASQMPIANKMGGFSAFLFGVFSVVFYDIFTRTLGLWTIFTALAYGVVGLGAFYFFKKYQPSKKNYVLYAIYATLFFDAITGLTVGPLFFNQSFYGALVGQIPFTLWHLAGNVGFALVLSPAISKFLNIEFAPSNAAIINSYSLQK